jgi:hypothetical protein
VASFIGIETGEIRDLKLENQPRNTARSSTETRREGDVSRAYDVAQIEISNQPRSRLYSEIVGVSVGPCAITLSEVAEG